MALDESEYGTITLTRARGGYRDALRRYRVLLDGAQVGLISRGRSLCFQVPPGDHQLQLRIDWCASPSVTAEVGPGQAVHYSCAPGGDPAQGLDGSVLGLASYIELRRVPAEAVVLSATLPAKLRLHLALTFVAFLSLLVFPAALIWRATGIAPHGADVAAAASMACFLVSCVLRRASRPH
ncbi:hypothetical protein [Streptacidiphilus monticola]|jgi:hypothetical protein|uniref:DUF2846 domain-containing protein n=1 Tax=Streptacidiphilus monticola TaxID=2161674 RepID=A0ABW1FZW4_9ACTN